MINNYSCVKAGLRMCIYCKQNLPNSRYCYLSYHYDCYIPDFFLTKTNKQMFSILRGFYKYNYPGLPYFNKALQLHSPQIYDRLHKLMVLI